MISYVTEAHKSLSTVLEHILDQKWCLSSLLIQKNKQDIFRPFFLFVDASLRRKSHEMKLIPPHKGHDRLPTPKPMERSQLRGTGLHVLII